MWTTSRPQHAPHTPRMVTHTRVLLRQQPTTPKRGGGGTKVEETARRGHGRRRVVGVPCTLSRRTRTPQHVASCVDGGEHEGERHPHHPLHPPSSNVCVGATTHAHTHTHTPRLHHNLQVPAAATTRSLSLPTTYARPPPSRQGRQLDVQTVARGQTEKTHHHHTHKE